MTEKRKNRTASEPRSLDIHFRIGEPFSPEYEAILLRHFVENCERCWQTVEKLARNRQIPVFDPSKSLVLKALVPIIRHWPVESASAEDSQVETEALRLDLYKTKRSGYDFVRSPSLPI